MFLAKEIPPAELVITAMAWSHLFHLVVLPGERPGSDLFRLPGVSASRPLHLGSPPAPADPRLNVVGQASPQRLTSHFPQPANPKLPAAQLGLQPKVAKRSYRSAPPINLARRVRLHLGPEGRDFGRLFGSPQRASAGSLRVSFRRGCVNQK
jgi:hypothetical protein